MTWDIGLDALEAWALDVCRKYSARDIEVFILRLQSNYDSRLW